MKSLQQKKRDVLLWKKYFSDFFKVKPSKNLWDSLPEDCKIIIREHQRRNSFAQRIQRHYRMVRYAPGTAPAFKMPDSMEIDDGYGGTREIYEKCQQVVAFWHPQEFKKTWMPGSVSTGKCINKNGKEFKYDAGIYFCSTIDGFDRYKYDYWYDPSNKNSVAQCSDDPEMVNIRKKYLIRHCVLIKPWDDM